jgi:hypothetical protein
LISWKLNENLGKINAYNLVKKTRVNRPFGGSRGEWERCELENWIECYQMAGFYYNCGELSGSVMAGTVLKS